jgi:hypothetical protein
MDWRSPRFSSVHGSLPSPGIGAWVAAAGHGPFEA